MTEEELDFLIGEFRKECEDLIRANIKDTFQIQYGELDIVADTPTVINLGEAYAASTLYEVVLFEATDSEGVNILDAVTISDKGTASFTLTSLRGGHIRWETALKTLKLDFWTDGDQVIPTAVTIIKRADGGLTRLLNGDDAVYFTNFSYDTNSTGIKLYTPLGVQLTLEYYPPSAWTIDGQSGFQTLDEVATALNSVQPNLKSGTIPTQDFKTWIVPSNLINGVTDTFMLPENYILGTVTGFTDYVPVFSSLQFTENELTLGSGVGATITFSQPPAAGTLIVLYYIKATA